jgi:hypothetical protein
VPAGVLRGARWIFHLDPLVDTDIAQEAARALEGSR